MEKKKDVKTAVALAYDTESGEAPYVIAAGKGENIPPELYEVVAQVLLFVDKMDRIKSAVAEKRDRK